MCQGKKLGTMNTRGSWHGGTMARRPPCLGARARALEGTRSSQACRKLISDDRVLFLCLQCPGGCGVGERGWARCRIRPPSWYLYGSRACPANKVPFSLALTSNKTAGEAYNGIETAVWLCAEYVLYPGTNQLDSPDQEVGSGNTGEQNPPSRHACTPHIAYKS